MKFGLDVPTTGEYADALVLAKLAQQAETAGWDAFLLWDVLLNKQPVIDPWIALTAVALHTTHIKIGLLVTPLPRHRPWLVARRLANLDQLSKGRLICTVGIGHQSADFAAFGEASDPHTRAEQLDEALTILNGFWTTDHFSYTGAHYTLHDVTLLPRPVQAPRIPLWVVGGWPNHAPVRRAACWDGLCLKSYHQLRKEPLTPDDLRECLTYMQPFMQQQRQSAATPFEVVVSGEASPDQQGHESLQAFAAAGATWWIEEGLGYPLAELQERILAGPPRGDE